MKSINDWKIWRLFMDSPTDWTPPERFQLWFDFWWSQHGDAICIGIYLLLAFAASFKLCGII